MKILAKYCRKCGATQEHTHVCHIAGLWWLYCDSCKAETELYAIRDDAIDAWNKGAAKIDK